MEKDLNVKTDDLEKLKNDHSVKMSQVEKKAKDLENTVEELSNQIIEKNASIENLNDRIDSLLTSNTHDLTQKYISKILPFLNFFL